MADRDPGIFEKRLKIIGSENPLAETKDKNTIQIIQILEKKFDSTTLCL